LNLVAHEELMISNTNSKEEEEEEEEEDECRSKNLQQWIESSCNSWALRVNLNSSRKNSRRLSSDQDPLFMICFIERI
jgi:hypothetical protein